MARNGFLLALTAAAMALAGCFASGKSGDPQADPALPPAVRDALGVSKTLDALRFDGRLVVVYPRPTQEVLVNPGMGIQTFQRYNGQALNPGMRWSEYGPLEELPPPATQPGSPLPPDVHPDFPESSVAYCRWAWRDLEPEEGRYRWEIIDRALAEARRHGQTLMIRLMPYVGGDDRPAWFKQIAAPGRTVPWSPPATRPGSTTRPASTRPARRPFVQPDFDDPQYLKHWGALVAAAGARYDGHPDLEAVDISAIGSCGEGGCRFMPTWANQKALTDIYFRAFQHTPLLVNIDAEAAAAYAVRRGAGWRLDCWGDMRSSPGTQGTWGHMLDVYPQQIIRLGMMNAWMTRPVSLETCWVPLKWKEEGRDVDYILAEALRWHASTVNIKSTAIPAEWKDPFAEFQKKLGYRFILRRLCFASEVSAGRGLPVSMLWLNDGVAPVYRPYTLAVQLNSAQAQAVLPVPVDVRTWLPGESLYEGYLPVPAGLKPGTYEMRVGLLDPNTGRPAIRLGIEARRPDGWYSFGTIAVK